jgi:hypothetical protein
LFIAELYLRLCILDCAAIDRALRNESNNPTDIIAKCNSQIEWHIADSIGPEFTDLRYYAICFNVCKLCVRGLCARPGVTKACI